MKKPESTLPSSAQIERELEAVSPEARAWLYAGNAELNRRRAADYERGARARAARRARVVEAVKDAAADIAAPLGVLPPEERAGWIETQIATKEGHYGLGKKLPSVELIQDILDTELLDQKL
ncbi:hypothetical protein [Polaromonas sp. JS666]|uniref:hypothetical protein n=1 Tax=Polaromonas sp. (strain JS666 / ATCC BAA-500) TaxID=296591 RepID=UPI0000464969|nr:hypothetical protein [Polaromonas sp. JS666]ABE43263.1 hypothetical protein Bpro_1313 [Polaromonas sp. JS666]